MASHRSALAIHELPIVGPSSAVPEITAPPSGTGSLVRAHLYRASLPAEHVTDVGGTPVTSVARALVDVGRDVSLIGAVAAIDAALYRGLIVESDIDDVLLRCWNWPGIRRAQHAVRLSDGRAESPLESVSRIVMGRLRLPRPEPQVTILDQHLRVVARADFYWDEFGVIGEADGRSKYIDRSVRNAEKDRQELLEDLGLVTTHWGWDLAWRRPLVLRDRLERAFERGRLRDRSGFRRLWSAVPS